MPNDNNPPTPVEPAIQPGNATKSETDLERRIKELEAQKLERENQILSNELDHKKRPVWQKPDIMFSALTVVISLLTLVAGFYTNILTIDQRSAEEKRELAEKALKETLTELTAITNRLATVEKLAADKEAKLNQLTSSVSGKEAELAEANRQLAERSTALDDVVKQLGELRKRAIANAGEAAKAKSSLASARASLSSKKSIKMLVTYAPPNITLASLPSVDSALKSIDTADKSLSNIK